MLWFYCLCRDLLWVTFKSFFGFKVFGYERIPHEGPLIVASNHASYLDPTILGPACWRPLGFMARRSLFDNRLFGTIIRNLYAFPLEREGDSREALRTFGKRLDEGRAVVLFPEGTRTVTGRIAAIKPGAGMLAVRHKAPVLPVYIWGSYQSWPKSRKLKRHPLEVYIGEPIYPRPVEGGRERRAEQDRINAELERVLREMEARVLSEKPAPVPLALLEKEEDASNSPDSDRSE